MSKRRTLCLVATLLALASALRAQTPLGTAFTYQGQLKDLGVPANGLHDFEFTLWDAESGGNQVAGPVQEYGLDVVNGLFTADLDFGAGVFNGDAVWLQIAVGPTGESLTVLSPRQPLSATPYALQTRGMFVDENLNVGIGTDLPEGVLDVRGPNGGDIHLGINDAGARIITTDAAGNLNLRPRVDGGGVFARDGNTPKGIQLYGGGVNRVQSVDLDGVSPFTLSINPDGGNVGIGTTTPGATLHLDSVAESVNLKLAGSEIADTYDGILRIRSGGGTVAFDGGDRVGIGTTTPEAALDLNGEMIHRGGALKHLGHDLIIADPARGDGGRALVHWGDGTNERLDINFGNDFDQGTFIHGNLGVGRAPNARLEVADGDIHLDAEREILFADNGQIRSRDDNHRILFRREDNKLELREWGDVVLSAGATTGEETASLVVKASGDVGVGTDSPQAKLHIAGAAGADGIMFPDGTLQTTAATGGGGGLTLPYAGTYSSSGSAFSITNTWGTPAITGLATNTGPGNGVGGYFQSDLDEGQGVFGGATGYAGRGVSGLATGQNGHGVHGETTHESGFSSAGVMGESSHGRGVVGLTHTSNEWVPAIYGKNEGIGDGLYGWSGSRHGTVGVTYSMNVDHAGMLAQNNGGGPGLIAKGGSGGYAAVFEGNVLIRTSGGTPLVELGDGLDYAEGFDVSENDPPAPGTVVVIDEKAKGKLTVSRAAYDHKVAGIVAGAQGLSSAVRLGIGRFDCDVALAGRVYCNVDAAYGPVKAGDLLTTSPTPGHAMVVTDPLKAQGAILGKAMEPLSSGQKGQILVLVTLQ